jgi:SAM-dependent methyltransferase
MVYDPLEYWDKRAKKYKHTERIDELENLINFVQKYNIKNILEVGSGEGRIYNYFLDKKISINFTMCDFSNSFRKKCKELTNVLPDSWDGKILPYNNDSFDLIISFSVLLHVLPDQIENIFQEHVRVSNKYIFIATWYEDLRGKSEEHCFEHDYYYLFKKNNLSILEDKKCYFEQGTFCRRNWLLKKCLEKE